MPTITANLADVERLVGKKLGRDGFEDMLRFVKAELKSHDEDTDEIRVECADGNRPDLWSPEGIARQIKLASGGGATPMPFFAKGAVRPSGSIVVDGDLEKIRPFIAGFTAAGFRVSEEALVGMIEAQEKLSEIFGRRRKSIAIGVYDSAKISWPVHYRAVEPSARRFVALGSDREMDLAGILAEHPKGIQYAKILSGFSLYPFIEDEDGAVLSFPPVINSAGAGMVEAGDDNLFVEVTGTDIRTVILASNIFAAILADRGAVITPCTVEYSYDTPMGREVVTPCDLSREVEIKLSEFPRVLGVEVTAEEAREVLGRYGCRVRGAGKSVFAAPPPWRDDYLHHYDAIEDFAVCRGYDTFEPQPLSSFTPGSLDPLTVFADQARDLMSGFGFEEIISNVLTSRAEAREKMGYAKGGLVEIENIYSETYSVVRDRILPSLMEVESQSVKALFPHRIFEEGDVAVRTASGVASRRDIAALVSHAEASFSEIQSYMSLLAYYLDAETKLEPADIEGYIPGRSARIMCGGIEVGVIGELHPAALEAWGLKMPVAAFEINLSALSPTRAFRT